jgi:MtN3 and saliva related transmembrane protein
MERQSLYLEKRITGLGMGLWRGMAMENSEIIGLIGMVLIVAAIYPQVFRLYRRKSSEDISVFLLVIMLTGSCFLITYAFIINSLTYKLLEIFFAAHLFITLILVIKYRKKSQAIKGNSSTNQKEEAPSEQGEEGKV